jgi:hypothetical protein
VSLRKAGSAGLMLWLYACKAEAARLDLGGHLMSRRVQISAIVAVACYASGANATQRARPTPPLSGGHSVVATANHKTSDYDCFSRASSQSATGLHLVGPTSVEWKRSSVGEITLVVDAINVGKKTWLVNGRGRSGFSPLPGDQEFVLRITETNGDRWVPPSPDWTEFEGLPPRRKDYVEVQGGTSRKIPIRLSGAMYPLSNGTYSVEVCFWDQWRYATEGRPGAPVFRGPVLLPTFRLSVVD